MKETTLNKVKFAIIGCGRIAQRHAKHIAAQGILQAVCDVKEERAIALAQEYNCKAYTSLEDLLQNEKDVDVISICSPNGLHSTQTIKSLRANKHVICEKPMALSVKDCENMIIEAENAHKRLYIVKQNRYNPPIKTLKETIEMGKLGRILSVQLNCFWNRNDAYYNQSDWKGSADMDGGTLYTQFSHFIDLILWLVGDIKSVQAMRKNFLHKNVIDFEDTGVLAVEFDNGAIGTINYTVNSYEKNLEGSLTIFAEKGTVKVGGQYLNTLEYQNIKDYKMEVEASENRANDYGFYQGSMSNHDKAYENIIKSLTGEKSNVTNAMEGLKVVRVIENIYKQTELS